MSCLAEMCAGVTSQFTLPSHDPDLCLAVIAIWQSLPLIYTKKAGRKLKCSKGNFSEWRLQDFSLVVTHNQLLKQKKKPGNLCELLSIPFSHLSLLGSLMSLCMSGLWLQSFRSTLCGGSPRLVGT